MRLGLPIPNIYSHVWEQLSEEEKRRLEEEFLRVVLERRKNEFFNLVTAIVREALDSSLVRTPMINAQAAEELKRLLTQVEQEILTKLQVEAAYFAVQGVESAGVCLSLVDLEAKIREDDIDQDCIDQSDTPPYLVEVTFRRKQYTKGEPRLRQPSGGMADNSLEFEIYYRKPRGPEKRFVFLLNLGENSEPLGVVAFCGLVSERSGLQQVRASSIVNDIVKKVIQGNNFREFKLLLEQMAQDVEREAIKEAYKRKQAFSSQ